MNKENIETKLAQVCANATVSAGKAVTTGARYICAKKATRYLFCFSVALISLGCSVAAEGGDVTGEVNSMIEAAMRWVRNIGVIVAVFGAVNFGLGFANQDDAGKNRGLMTVAGGAIVGIAGQIAITIE